MTEPEHHWALERIDPDAGGQMARMVKLRCTVADCGETMVKLTQRTDDEIRAELEAQNV